MNECLFSVYGGYKYMNLLRDLRYFAKKVGFICQICNSGKETESTHLFRTKVATVHVGLWKLSYKPCSLKYDHDSYNSWDLIHEVIWVIKIM